MKPNSTLFNKIILTLVLLAVSGSFNLLNARSIPKFLSGDTSFIEKKNFQVCNKLMSYKNHLPSTLERESAIVHRPYDVLSYNLFMDWTKQFTADNILNENRYYSGVNQIIMKIDSANVKEIVLDAADFLQIDTIKINSYPKTIFKQIIKNPPQPSNYLLTIPLPDTVKQGDSIKITILYTYKGTSDWGFYFYEKGTYVGQGPQDDSVFTEERIAYTMSEPRDARMWMPCNDWPYDKAQASISVRVPKGISVASNGLLTKVDSTDTDKTYYWEDDTPIATYLMAVTASKYHEYSDWYERVTKPGDSVEVKYYIWEGDYTGTATDGSQYNARFAFQSTVDMMKFFSNLYGEYPFKKYGMVAIQPFNFGGMEHQTLTSIIRGWLRGWSSSGIAHELAHQWIGDMITCATWNDVWINEGGATWSEANWAKTWGGEGGYYYMMSYNRLAYLQYGGLSFPPIYGLPIETIFGGNAVLVYQKASWVYHMLKSMLGDSIYYDAFHSMLNKYRFKSLETKDFEKSFTDDVKDPIVPFDIFFDQWLYHGGHPVFKLNTSTSKVGETYQSTVTINQVQSGEKVPSMFYVPADILFYGPNDTIISKRLLTDQQNQTATFELPFMPDSVKIDENQILCENAESIVSVKENRTNEQIPAHFVYPNPISTSNKGTFQIFIEKPETVNICLIDELGNKIANIYDGYLSNGKYDIGFSTNELATGLYFIRCSFNNNIVMSKFSVLR
jgi:aminopeptidase N